MGGCSFFSNNNHDEYCVLLCAQNYNYDYNCSSPFPLKKWVIRHQITIDRSGRIDPRVSPALEHSVHLSGATLSTVKATKVEAITG